MSNFRFLLFFSDVKSTAIIFIQSFDKYVVFSALCRDNVYVTLAQSR